MTRILYPLEGSPASPGPVVFAGVLTLVAAVALSAWQARPAEPQPDAYQKWVQEDVVYIISPQERAAFLNLASDPERDRFMAQFWERRDPTPDTARNEFEEEHYRRIGFVNARYRVPQGAAGWKTDRGRIYIQYGPPDEMEVHPVGEAAGAAYEEWLYRSIPGVGERVIMRFVDAGGNGDYRMTRDPAAGPGVPLVPLR